METKQISAWLRILSIASLVYLLTCIPVYLAAKNFVHVVMIWNLFLAALPLLFAWLVRREVLSGRSGKAHGIKVAVWSLLWLFFFPNAPYLVTDLIHTSRNTYFIRGASGTVYVQDFSIWLSLAHIAAGVFLGTAIGLFSLYLIHRLLLQWRGRLFSTAVVGIVCLLSGYAVYLGRFLRLNSWDLLRPGVLFSRILENLSPFCLWFSLLFAGYLLFLYAIFYGLLSAGERGGR